MMRIDDVVLTCCNSDCGISFSVPAWWVKGKRENHSWWYCPNGHHQHFPQESEIEKMRRERDRYAQQVAQRDDEIAAQGKTIRSLKRRAAAGTCPCCQRTFTNMSRHMKTKHLDFGADNVVKLKAKR